MKRLIIVLIFLLPALFARSQKIPSWKITEVEKMINAVTEGILVLNFWATFCKPCVAEIPGFIKVAEKFRDNKVKLVLISLDLPNYYPKKISDFAKQHAFNTNIAWLKETDADYFCPKIDKAWSGAIPATLIINTKTRYRFFTEGELTEEAFETALKKAAGN